MQFELFLESFHFIIVFTQVFGNIFFYGMNTKIKKCENTFFFSKVLHLIILIVPFNDICTTFNHFTYFF